MTEEKKQIAVAVIVTWLLIIMFFMILTRSINTEIFFVLWLIGLLVIIKQISPSFIQPSYLFYLKFLIALGITIFTLMIVQKVMEIISI
jgi:hypothetical protein